MIESGRRRGRGWDVWMASEMPSKCHVWMTSEMSAMASLTQWIWAWVNSGSWWWTGRPGVLQSMGSQRVRHELNWTEWSSLCWVSLLIVMLSARNARGTHQSLYYLSVLLLAPRWTSPDQSQCWGWTNPVVLITAVAGSSATAIRGLRRAESITRRSWRLHGTPRGHTVKSRVQRQCADLGLCFY